MDAVKEVGLNTLGQEFQEEAERIAVERNRIEQQIEKLKSESSIREKTVADEQVIAESLSQFSRVFDALTFEEQKELVELLIGQIRVERIADIHDSKLENNQTTTRLRNKLYLVEIDFTSDKLVLKKIRTGDGRFVKRMNWRPVGDSNPCCRDENPVS